MAKIPICNVCKCQLFDLNTLSKYALNILVAYGIRSTDSDLYVHITTSSKANLPGLTLCPGQPSIYKYKSIFESNHITYIETDLIDTNKYLKLKFV